MNRLRVELAGRPYDILIGERLTARAGELLSDVLPAKRTIILTDESVARLYLHRLTGALEDVGIRSRSVIVPAGEGSKSFARFEQVVETILEQKPDRRTVLIALGGGVVGDLTGFVASVLLRGLEFIQIPTTLLAQVDSSVGGKTAINSRYGKNLVGAFHQPARVLIDISLLSTLSEREFRSGYAEVVKYGLLGDKAFFEWLEKNGRDLRNDAAKLAHAIEQSCRAKADIVAEDERETGRRALLNLGHTFAHAFEAETGYSDKLLHGEAVGMGMALAFDLSARLGLCAAQEAERASMHLRAMGLADIKHEWNVDALMEHFTRDKKAKDGALTFVLARGIGEAFVADGVDAYAVRRLLEERFASR